MQNDFPELIHVNCARILTSRTARRDKFSLAHSAILAIFIAAGVVNNQGPCPMKSRA